MPWNKSITAKFIVVLFLVLLVGQGGGAYFFLRYTRSNLLADLHGRMERMAGQSAAVVAEPILNYNFPLIEAYLEQTLQDQDVLAVSVVDAEGQTVRETSADRTARDTFTVTHPISLGDTALGEFRISYAGRTIDSWMSKSLLVIPSYQLGMLFAVAGILIVLLNYNIRNPVAEINRVVGKVTTGDLTVAMPRFREDDIGVIAQGVRFLVERLALTITRINAIALNATEVMRQLNSTFETVNQVVNSQQSSIAEVAVSVKSASQAQGRVADGTGELLSLSEGNAAALLEMRATSEEIAGGTEKLSGNINNSITTLTELTQSAQEVARMADDATHAIEESSVSIEEIFGSLKEVDAMVRQSTQLSDVTASIVSAKGMAAVTNVSESMRGIKSFMSGLTDSIGAMETRSQDIGKVLEVIGEVTDQVKLLSLNAQIIAAQAGQHGRSFSVVADEMRELSERTASSTQQIAGIVSQIQDQIMGVVQGSRNVVRVVDDSNEAVQRTAEIFTEILDSSKRAATISQQIERATLEQTRGLDMVVRANEQVRERILEVNRATGEQERSTGFLLRNLSPIREAMEMTLKATQEQARSSRLISDNLELANKKTADISGATQEQQAVNLQIIAATEELLRMAELTAREVQGNSGFLNSLSDEIVLLKNEMEQFLIAET